MWGADYYLERNDYDPISLGSHPPTTAITSSYKFLKDVKNRELSEKNHTFKMSSRDLTWNSFFSPLGDSSNVCEPESLLSLCLILDCMWVWVIGPMPSFPWAIPWNLFGFLKTKSSKATSILRHNWERTLRYKTKTVCIPWQMGG